MPIYEEKLICPLAIHFTQDPAPTRVQIPSMAPQAESGASYGPAWTSRTRPFTGPGPPRSEYFYGPKRMEKQMHLHESGS